MIVTHAVSTIPKSKCESCSKRAELWVIVTPDSEYMFLCDNCWKGDKPCQLSEL